MKFYKKKNKRDYLILTDIKIRSFDYIWNPQGEKIITKKHLELFLKEAFPRNFLFYRDYGFFNYSDIKNFTPFSYLWFLSLYSLRYNNLRCRNPEFIVEHVFLVFDAVSIYKRFAHLLSEEDFSSLLRIILMSMGFEEDDDEDLDCFFFSSKESLKNFLKDKGEEEKLIKDLVFWNKNSLDLLERLEENRARIIDEKEIKRRSVIVDDYYIVDEEEYDKIMDKIK